MKQLTPAFFIFAFSLAVKGQHTLSFNQTLLLTSGNSYTVPANATWKVESVFFNSNYTSIFYGAESNYAPSFTITPPGGGATTVYYMGASYYDSAPTSASALPCWLPAGTLIQLTGVTGMASVIEFVIQ